MVGSRVSHSRAGSRRIASPDSQLYHRGSCVEYTESECLRWNLAVNCLDSRQLPVHSMAPLNQTQMTPASQDPSAPPRGGGGSAIIAGLLVPHAVCTIFIATRAWSRLRVLHKWFLDDTLIVAAWVFSTAVCVVYTIAAELPSIAQSMVLTASRDAGPLGDEDVRPYLLRTYLGLIFYQMCLCLTKLSILSFYLRMFSSRPLERRLAWATVCLVLAFGLPLLAMSIFQCHPVTGEFFGSRGGGGGGGGGPLLCFSFTPLLIASASLHTVTDAWLIVLVVPCVWTLELPPRQRAALGVVLSLGVFVMAASLTRLQLSLHANLRPSGSGVQATDALAFFVMTILECDVALICACAPTLRPLLARLWPRSSMGEDPAKRRTSGRTGGGGGGGRRLARRRTHSANLTSIISHQGVYPWAAKSEADSASSKQRHQQNQATLQQARIPVPPAPTHSVAYRTPTTLSLKSLMSVVSPRSRSATVTDRAEDRAVLLRDGDSMERRRRSSAGSHGHERTRADNTGKGNRNSNGAGAGEWSHSQESFVLGMNDPASPHRLSPVSGFSGPTLADADSQSSGDEGAGLEMGRQTRARTRTS
ncbi:hypothetical protein RB601_003214 [Gaeumannomyces tritici]